MSTVGTTYDKKATARLERKLNLILCAQEIILKNATYASDKDFMAAGRVLSAIEKELGNG